MGVLGGAGDGALGARLGSQQWPLHPAMCVQGMEGIDGDPLVSWRDTETPDSVRERTRWQGGVALWITPVRPPAHWGSGAYISEKVGISPPRKTFVPQKKASFSQKELFSLKKSLFFPPRAAIFPLEIKKERFPPEKYLFFLKAPVFFQKVLFL